jgi:type VI secretion system ImpB/VipA family protein
MQGRGEGGPIPEFPNQKESAVNEQKTSIVVESADPPPQPVGQDEPYELIVADLSGYREEDTPPDWTTHEVSTSTYESRLRDNFKPRFRAEVEDHLTGKPGSKLTVDITFTGTTQNMPHELDKVPELDAVVKLIRQLEHLKRHLSQQVSVRNRLEALLGAAVEEPSAN